MKRSALGLCVAMSAALAASETSGPASIHTLTPDGKATLVHQARLALDAAVARRAPSEFAGDRSAFEGPATPVRCTLRREGRIVATGLGNSTHLVDAAILAIHDAITRAPKRTRPKKRHLGALRIELHIPDAVELRARLTIPGLRAKYDAGYTGVGARMGDRFLYQPAPFGYETPSDFNTLTETLAHRVGHPRGEPLDDAVSFTTASELHLVETDAIGGWVELRRGLRVDTPDVVESGDLADSVRRGADWLLRHQREDGSYEQRYYPFDHRFSGSHEMLYQALAAHAVSTAAKRLQDETLERSAARSIGFLLRQVRRLPSSGALYVHDTGHAHTGTTALTLVALATADPERHAETIRSLALALAAQIDEDGRVHTSFLDPADDHLEQAHSGPSLYALAAIYRQTGLAELAAPLTRGLARARQEWTRHKTREAVPWNTRAAYEMYLASGDLEYADWAFESQDFILRVAWTRERTKRPDYLGGIGRKPPGADTADFLIGTAASYEMARRLGDESRRRFYGTICRGASRFLTRLQVKPDEAYYLSPSEQTFALGAFRGSLIDHDLRLEATANAMLALLEVRELAGAALSPETAALPGINPFENEDLTPEEPDAPAPDPDED